MHHFINATLALYRVSIATGFSWFFSGLLCAQNPGQPFERLATQVAALQVQVQSMQSQIESLQQALADTELLLDQQRDLCAALQERMIYENGTWVGWRDLRLHGATHFTNSQDDSHVWINQADAPVVQIVTPYSPELFGKRVALKTTGHTQLISTDPSSQYHSSLEVVGPAWFRQSALGEVRMIINGATSPNYAVRVIGPTAIVDELGESAQYRLLTFFTNPNRPIDLTRIFTDSNSQALVESRFSVWMAPSSNVTSVLASEFIQQP